MSEDHLGQDGIETVEDVLRIKSVVTDSVRAGGKVILNADDERLGNLARTQIDKRGREGVILFAMDRANPLIHEHCTGGGEAVYCEDGWIIHATGTRQERLIRDVEVPFTIRGLARFQIANALAAVPICVSQGVRHETIVKGLKDFNVSTHNKGRLNIYRVDRGYVVLDYGHNPAAFGAICEFASHWPGPVTAVVGAPGDRKDELIAQSARQVIAGFDKLIVRDDFDLRGRVPGEVPSIFAREFQAIGRGGKSCRVIIDEIVAIQTAVQEMKRDELVVIFYDEKENIENILRNFNAVPCTLPELPITIAERPISRPAVNEAVIPMRMNG